MATTVQDVLACSVPGWYPALAHCSFPCRFVALDDEALRYLHADGVFMPGDDNGDEHGTPQLGALRRWIDESIAQLDNEVVPKLNWSTPKDAVWISPFSTLKCRTADDVFLLLKSSDHIAYDLEHPFDLCVDKDTAPRNVQYYLVLRQWYDFPASMEFRCFVVGGYLVGISQRDHGNYYSFLAARQDDICEAIATFFYRNLFQRLRLQRYVFDVVVTSSFQSARLMDINPFGSMTEPLLFDWEEMDDLLPTELQEVTSVDVNDRQLIRELCADIEFRLVPEASSGIRPSTLLSSRVPQDVYNFVTGGGGSGGSHTSGIDDFVRHFQANSLGQRPQSPDSDSDATEDEADVDVAVDNHPDVPSK